MIEVSIIVQLREVAGEKRGRIAVGFARGSTEAFADRPKWARLFFSALDRAVAKRRANLSEIRELANSPGPLFEEPF